jgi:glycosyltransferase involved in cell wall biosynthesis
MNTSSDSPFFSVCIPTYNTAKYIGEAIESVLQQTFTDFEIIVSDNCSTDNTEELVSQFKHDKIQYFKNERNLQAYPNVSLAIQRARGRYVKILCADDKLSPFCLQVIYEQLKKHEFKPGGVCVGYSRLESELQMSPVYECESIIVNKQNFFEYIGSEINTNLGGFLGSICASREVFAEVGYFGTDPSVLEEDCYRWLKIVLATDCLLIDQPIIYYFRSHEAQGNKTLNKIVTLNEHFIFFKDNSELLASLLPDNTLIIQKYLDVKVGNSIIRGLYALFQRGDFKFLFEVSKSMLKYKYYRIPFKEITGCFIRKIKRSILPDKL